MARTGGRRARLLVAALALAAAGALWMGGGTARANCPVSDPNCMGGGGSMDTTPPATNPPSQSVTNSNSGPQVQVVTPQPRPAPQTKRVYTPAPRSKPDVPAVSGSPFIPALPDTPPPDPPKPGPEVSLTGVSAAAPGAGTALIAGLPPAPGGGSSPSPLLPAAVLLGGAAVLAAPLGKGAAPKTPPPPAPPNPECATCGKWARSLARKIQFNNDWAASYAYGVEKGKYSYSEYVVARNAERLAELMDQAKRNDARFAQLGCGSTPFYFGIGDDSGYKSLPGGGWARTEGMHWEGNHWEDYRWPGHPLGEPATEPA